MGPLLHAAEGCCQGQEKGPGQEDWEDRDSPPQYGTPQCGIPQFGTPQCGPTVRVEAPCVLGSGAQRGSGLGWACPGLQGPSVRFGAQGSLGADG